MTKGKIPYEICLISAAKTFILISSDGKSFEVDEALAFQSLMLKDVIESCNCEITSIPLPIVPSNILSKVIDYCIMHVESPNYDDEKDVKAFDSKFVEMDSYTLLDLLLAANYLEIKGLLGVLCEAVQNAVKNMTPQGIRKFFNIKDNFIPEEDEEVRRENAWAFE